MARAVGRLAEETLRLSGSEKDLLLGLRLSARAETEGEERENREDQKAEARAWGRDFERGRRELCA